MRSLKYAALLLALTLALVIAACGEDPGDSTTGDSASLVTPATSDAATDGKLSANNATVEELEAAFCGGGDQQSRGLGP